MRVASTPTSLMPANAGTLGNSFVACPGPRLRACVRTQVAPGAGPFYRVPSPLVGRAIAYGFSPSPSAASLPEGWLYSRGDAKVRVGAPQTNRIMRRITVRQRDGRPSGRPYTNLESPR